MTLTINENIEYLLDDAIELGRVRSDCPECGSGNTFFFSYVLPTSMVVRI